MTDTPETADLRARLADAERRLARRPGGRPARAPETADARLVARVCRERRLTRTELADLLGCVPSALSQANTPRGLASAHRAALQAMAAKVEKVFDKRRGRG